MKKSLGKKICMVGIGLIIMLVILNIILTYFFMIPFSVYRSKQQMEKIAVSLQNDDSYSDDEFREIIEQISEELNTQVTIVDGEKKIISTNRESYLEKDALNRRTAEFFDENKDKIDAGNSVSRTKVQTKGKKKSDENRIIVLLIKKVAEDRYVILSRSYRSLQNATYSAIIFDVVAGIVIVFMGILVVLWLSRYLLTPIKNMTETAERISNLEFDMKVPVDTEDELGQLGQSINRMSEQLEENLIELQGDIEKRKRLVRNLSHEIKSPVAVMMGYADRLKKVVKNDPDKAVQYCEIISDESARVDMLVREMLELSKLEQQAEELHSENFAVGRLFEDLKKRFQEETIDRVVHYVEEYDESEQIWADYMMLERAVYNLLRNALNHGAMEDLTVRIKGQRKESYYEILVYNTGNQIAEEECASIWEAFSKVDKARTRGRQGFGVGLSIVKEIVEAHKGYYFVRNMEDGVEFGIAIKG